MAESASLVAWQGDAYRLIPSRFPPVAVYEGLVAKGRNDALVAIENITNPRLKAEERIAERAAEVARESARLQNWNLAPFAYGNPDGSTFFSGARPCLEVADDRQTALAVSVARRQRFLSCTSEAPIGLDMRMFKTPIVGRFWDLRPEPVDLSRDDRWKLGAALPEKADGILYRPPERPSATCIAIVNGEILGRTLQTVHYRFVWNGVRIMQLYAFEDAGQLIDPACLSEEHYILAA